MDKLEKIRLIMDKVSELETESFFLGVYGSDESLYVKHNQKKNSLIQSLYDLLEDLL